MHREIRSLSITISSVYTDLIAIKGLRFKTSYAFIRGVSSVVQHFNAFSCLSSKKEVFLRSLINGRSECQLSRFEPYSWLCGTQDFSHKPQVLKRETTAKGFACRWNMRWSLEKPLLRHLRFTRRLMEGKRNYDILRRQRKSATPKVE